MKRLLTLYVFLIALIPLQGQEKPLNPVKNQFGIEVNNGFGGGFTWTHYYKSLRKLQLQTTVGLVQYTSIYNWKSFSIPMQIAVARNKRNNLNFYLGSGVTFNFDPWHSLETSRELYFEGGHIESGSTFPIEQPLEFGIGGNWLLGDAYYLKISGGPFMGNIFTPTSGIIVRLQFGINYPLKSN